MDLLVVLVCIIVALAMTAAYYMGYNDAVDDVKATGRLPELEDLCNTNTTKTG